MLEVGNGFAVMGDWDTSPVPVDRIVIRMPPLPVGGYGIWNKTTQMCIAALEREVQPGMSVLDFGTGSGILAMVAHHLGAAPVYATEIDPAMIEYAGKVWELNQCPVQLVSGELPAVDLCVANIGDQFWDQRHTVKATRIINISNEGDEVVINA